MTLSAELPALSGIDAPFKVDDATVQGFRKNGHAVVRGLASAEEIAEFAPPILAQERALAAKAPPLEERSTYFKAFLQGHNLWMRDPAIKPFVFSARFAKVAADLMGVPGVRLYHDQSLTKEPGGGHTPWHQDQTYWPLDTDDTITMWMPLVDVPADVGSMTFANQSHIRRDLGPWVIGDESEAAFSEMVEREGFSTSTHGPMKAGDATFHRGWTLHRAPANPTDLVRSSVVSRCFNSGPSFTASEAMKASLLPVMVSSSEPKCWTLNTMR
jgi:ectoine hydroxylase-related dioxygenase (phytanoyl-CoA dioxygenase family)